MEANKGLGRRLTEYSAVRGVWIEYDLPSPGGVDPRASSEEAENPLGPHRSYWIGLDAPRVYSFHQTLASANTYGYK